MIMDNFDRLTDDQLRALRDAWIAARRGRKLADYDRMTRKLDAVWVELQRRGADT
jgi:hypothetical protein